MWTETAIRLAAFLGLFALFAVLEYLAPRRILNWPKMQRWRTNLSITLLNTLATRGLAILLPLLAVGAALNAGTRGLGLLNQIALPAWAEVALGILILDFAIWAQHLISHKVPAFWRFHRMHHADPDIDVSTALRFHPVEILASMGVKIAVVYIAGPSALAVLLFEIILNGTAMFNHANLRLPQGADRALRMVLVTPDMHRVHHSADIVECNSNYGFALSIWDRIFHTYTAQPGAGHAGMTVGLNPWQNDKPTRLGWALRLPFHK